MCHGFRLKNVEVKILSYTDDVAVFCVDKSSAGTAFTLAKPFCDATSAAINWNKCRWFGHDACATAPSVFEGVRYDGVSCAYLGVPLMCCRNSKTF